MPQGKMVKKAQKPQGQCGRCGDELPVGAPYRYWKFRYGGKRKRCMKPGCAPRGSELTQAKWGDALAAIEDARTMVNEYAGIADMMGALEMAAEEIRNVAEEYAEAAEAMGGAGEQNEERADQLEAAADDLEQGAEGLSDMTQEDAHAEAEALLDNAEGEVML
jgi:hypothetical protein